VLTQDTGTPLFSPQGPRQGANVPYNPSYCFLQEKTTKIALSVYSRVWGDAITSVFFSEEKDIRPCSSSSGCLPVKFWPKGLWLHVSGTKVSAPGDMGGSAGLLRAVHLEGPWLKGRRGCSGR
jgi:hypothetical protein